VLQRGEPAAERMGIDLVEGDAEQIGSHYHNVGAEPPSQERPTS
jgi:hypothetical protein